MVCHLSEVTKEASVSHQAIGGIESGTCRFQLPLTRLEVQGAVTSAKP